MRSGLAVMAAFTLLALAGGCRRGSEQPTVERAWVRLAAVAGRPAAGYLTVHGGAAPTRVVAIDSPAAGSTELHEGMGDGGGMMTMRRLDGIDVAPRASVALAPGGRHLMMFGVAPALKPGDTVAMTVRFAKGPPVAVRARAVAAGDAAPY